MKNKSMLRGFGVILALSLCAAAIPVLASHAKTASITTNGGKAELFSNTLVDSYYAPVDSKPARMVKKSIFANNLTYWVNSDLEEAVSNATYNYDSFCAVQVLDEDLQPVNKDEALYTCTFSAKDGRMGYIVLRYDAAGSALKRVRAAETAVLYDLKACEQEIAAHIVKTKLDLSTATAQRVSIRSDATDEVREGILFKDAQGRKCVYFFGSNSLASYT